MLSSARAINIPGMPITGVIGFAKANEGNAKMDIKAHNNISVGFM